MMGVLLPRKQEMAEAALDREAKGQPAKVMDQTVDRRIEGIGVQPDQDGLAPNGVTGIGDQRLWTGKCFHGMNLFPTIRIIAPQANHRFTGPRNGSDHKEAHFLGQWVLWPITAPSSVSHCTIAPRTIF